MNFRNVATFLSQMLGKHTMTPVLGKVLRTAS